eukprot:4131953-Pyramimonas_sp.AAC.1
MWAQGVLVLPLHADVRSMLCTGSAAGAEAGHNVVLLLTLNVVVLLCWLLSFGACLGLAVVAGHVCAVPVAAVRWAVGAGLVRSDVEPTL